jgi:molecular chaperone DnaJ
VADDLYEVLGVARTASPEEIKKAYRRRAREHHPDAGGDEEQFKRVTHAHQVLSDPERRARYDRFGDDGTSRPNGGGDPFGFGGLGDVLDAFFGGAATGGGRARANAQGRDVLVPTQVSLEDVLHGGELPVDVEVARACDVCGGSGSASGAAPSACSTCGGRGAVARVVRTAFGQMSTNTTCPACQGAGREVTDPCSGCGGDGRRVTGRTVTVELPVGIEHGTRLRVPGAGEAGRHGATPGDLFVEVRIAPHEVYERDGRDLWADLSVPMTLAALGGTVTVPVLDDDEVELDVPPGSQPGDVLSLRRHGLPGRSGRARGDIKLRLRVEVPTALTTEERDALTRFADLRGEEHAARGLVERLRDALRG